MRRRKHLSIKSVTVAGIATSVLLALGAVTLSAPPAGAVVYCQYVEYPAGCVARAGVVLRPRPVARAAVRHNAGGNANGGVNRVGAGRERLVSRSRARKKPSPLRPGGGFFIAPGAGAGDRYRGRHHGMKHTWYVTFEVPP